MCDHDQKLPFNSIPFWLLIAAFSLAFTTRHALAVDEGQAAAKDRSVSLNATPLGFPNRITTLDGKTYEKVTLERVDPDGLLVVFAPVKGGSGTAKLKFRNLPVELRERYGYDPAQASDYETAQARGEAIWRAENAVWAEQRRAAQAEEAARERQMRAEAELRLAAEAEQARADAARNIEPSAYYNPGCLWPDNYNSIGCHLRPAPYNNQGLPAAGCWSSPVSPIIRPIRPSGK